MANAWQASVETGMMFVNNISWSDAELPFGGIKYSGYGRELGNMGIQEFVNKKLVRFGNIEAPHHDDEWHRCCSAEKPEHAGAPTMKALVYLGDGKKAFQDKPKPAITAPTDAIVKIVKTTICGTDLHILKGDVPTAKPGRMLGHEGVGIIDEAGAAVQSFKKGDRVLISCVTSCGTCEYCRRLMYSHCVNGGWILGNEIDGTQAEFVRIPYADTSLYPILDGEDEEPLVMFSDIFPTGYECGVLNGQIAPGSTVAIVGSGPIGLAALLTAQFYSPAEDDHDRSRPEAARHRQALRRHEYRQQHGREKAKEDDHGDHAGVGVDTAIEAVGIPATFELCEQIVAPGGHIANIGVHGKPVALHLEQLWDRNIGITTRLVDTVSTPTLLKMQRAQKIDPQEAHHAPLQTHRHHLRVRYVRQRGDDRRAQGHPGGLVFVNVAVLKETQAHERRVALVPAVAPKLIKLGAKLHMQSGAGDAVGLPDSAYEDVAFVDRSRRTRSRRRRRALRAAAGHRARRRDEAGSDTGLLRLRRAREAAGAGVAGTQDHLLCDGTHPAHNAGASDGCALESVCSGRILRRATRCDAL